jgi:hypothetical protein
MDVPENRRWMDNRLDSNRHVTAEFIAGVNDFITLATSQENYQRDGKLRCPRKKCKCQKFKYVDDVMVDLYEKGFMPNYYYRTNHGETLPPFPPTVVEDSS